MTTETQRRSNRRNARRSTGPRTDAGKARASANARTHGLNTAPDPDDVLDWYRILLEDPEARLPGRDATERQRAALELAVAEAALERACRAERDHLDTLAEVMRGRGRRSLAELAERREREPGKAFRDEDVLEHLIRAYSDVPFFGEAFRLFLRITPNRPAKLHRRMRTLRSYRRRAEGRRRTAFRHWLAAEE